MRGSQGACSLGAPGRLCVLLRAASTELRVLFRGLGRTGRGQDLSAASVGWRGVLHAAAGRGGRRARW